jgi:threonine synthase
VNWPRLAASDLTALKGLGYDETALRVMTPFIDGAIAHDDFAAMVADAYRGFDQPEVAPLAKLGQDEWLLELFHGPTLSFKDYALQLVGRLLDHLLRAKGRRATVLVATSGDTGSAAIEACRDRKAIDIVVLHPKGRVSEVQRRQMTSVLAPNVHNIAVEGNFDDCQTLVKALFADERLRAQVGLAAMNSINWARIMAQIVYYVVSAVKLGAPDKRVAFAVPTGNFGNVYAAYAARRMGLPISQLIVASNANDILARFFASGEMRMGTVTPTLAPSMDIQVSSNFERYLADLIDGTAGSVAALMERFRRDHEYSLDAAAMTKARADFDGFRLDDTGTLAVMRAVHERSGMLVDPHSAIGVAAGRARRRDPKVPLVAVATAHPAKFPDAVEQATGIRPALPARLADLFQRPERYEAMTCNPEALKDYIRSAARVAA